MTDTETETEKCGGVRLLYVTTQSDQHQNQNQNPKPKLKPKNETDPKNAARLNPFKTPEAIPRLPLRVDHTTLVEVTRQHLDTHGVLRVRRLVVVVVVMVIVGTLVRTVVVGTVIIVVMWRL